MRAHIVFCHSSLKFALDIFTIAQLPMANP